MAAEADRISLLGGESLGLPWFPGPLAVAAQLGGERGKEVAVHVEGTSAASDIGRKQRLMPPRGRSQGKGWVCCSEVWGPYVLQSDSYAGKERKPASKGGSNQEPRGTKVRIERERERAGGRERGRERGSVVP